MDSSSKVSGRNAFQMFLPFSTTLISMLAFVRGLSLFFPLLSDRVDQSFIYADIISWQQQ